MVQILKENIKKRIKEVAIELFYMNGFAGTKMQEIAEKAHISVGLSYSYYQNKQELFASIVEPIYQQIIGTVEKPKDLVGKQSQEYNLFRREPAFILQLLKLQRKPFLILMDQSKGTRFENARDQIVKVTRKHIEQQLSPKIDPKAYQMDPIFYHILANNFVEGLLEIARHYQGHPWAENMLHLLVQQYFYGVQGFHRKS